MYDDSISDVEDPAFSFCDAQVRAPSHSVAPVFSEEEDGQQSPDLSEAPDPAALSQRQVNLARPHINLSDLGPHMKPLGCEQPEGSNPAVQALDELERALASGYIDVREARARLDFLRGAFAWMQTRINQLEASNPQPAPVPLLEMDGVQPDQPVRPGKRLIVEIPAFLLSGTSVVLRLTDTHGAIVKTTKAVVSSGSTKLDFTWPAAAKSKKPFFLEAVVDDQVRARSAPFTNVRARNEKSYEGLTPEDGLEKFPGLSTTHVKRLEGLGVVSVRDLAEISPEKKAGFLSLRKPRDKLDANGFQECIRQAQEVVKRS